MANVVTKEMLDAVVSGIVMSKICSIKPDKDSAEQKQINLEVSFDGVALRAIFAKAMGGTVITWQNGPGRSKFDSWKSGQTVKVSFTSPAKRIETPEELMARTAATVKSLPAEEKAAYMKMLEDLMNG